MESRVEHKLESHKNGKSDQCNPESMLVKQGNTEEYQAKENKFEPYRPYWGVVAAWSKQHCRCKQCKDQKGDPFNAVPDEKFFKHVRMVKEIPIYN